MTVTQLQKSSALVDRAYKFAKKAHGNQKRASGEPFFNHALATAEYLARWGLDEDTIAAGLLHDVVEDTDVTAEDVEKEFGNDVRFLVDGVTKIAQVEYRSDMQQVENLRKLILSMAEDLRVILIKLADRLHNMKTLKALPANKRRRISLETMEIYAPLAYRLGMQGLAGELQDLAFPYIHPKEFQWIRTHIQERYEERESYLKKIKPRVEKALQDGKVKVHEINFRAKRYSSLYQKLLRYEMDVERIYDLVAFRIIVNSVEDCYATLGIIHNLWPPIPGRIKDYIATPKSNRYRSLHTTILGPDQRIVEFQIRTEQMHKEAENGIAAHWAYNRTRSKRKRRASIADEKEIVWVEQLRNWQKEFTDSEEFIKAFKIDFLKDRILAITPKGEVIDLPRGSTPVDFAYHIHTEVGHGCVAAKVNGKIVPLDHKLKSSDVIEILTQKNKKPSPSWLNFVETATARSHIRNSLRESGSKSKLIGKVKNQTELKITAEDKVGLLNDVTAIISRSHINIISVQSSPRMRSRGKFHTIRVVCDTGDKNKIWKIILKLKSLKDIKEVDYRFV